jgi:hypothetical protein
VVIASTTTLLASFSSEWRRIAAASHSRSSGHSETRKAVAPKSAHRQQIGHAVPAEQGCASRRARHAQDPGTGRSAPGEPLAERPPCSRSKPWRWRVVRWARAGCPARSARYPARAFQPGPAQPVVVIDRHRGDAVVAPDRQVQRLGAGGVGLAAVIACFSVS